MPRKQDGSKLRQRLAMKRTMRLGTWNIRGISDKISEITSELKKYKLDIAVLSETKRKGKGNEEFDGYIYFWSGVNKYERARSGIAVLVKNHLKQFITDYNYISERILTVTLKVFGHETLIVAVYAPIDASDNQTKDQFYGTLSDILSRAKGHQDIIVAGDLNARIKGQEDSNVVGKFADELQNDSGNRLIEISSQYKLQLANTCFAHKDIHRYTWERPSMQQRSIIDYIIVKQNSRFKVFDARVMRGANCGTDHHLLVATLVYPFPCNHNNRPNDTHHKTNSSDILKPKRYKLYLLQEDSVRDLYQRRLANELNAIEFLDNVEVEHEYIKNAMHTIAAETLGEYRPKTSKPSQPKWISDDIRELIKEKNEHYKKFLMHRTEENNRNYKEKNRELRNKIKKEKNNFWEQKCNQINAYVGGSRSTEVWQTIKNLKNNSRRDSLSLINNEQWKDYYESLLVERREEFLIDETELEDNEDFTFIDMKELKECVGEMKNGRSPGPGDIPAELYKYGGEALLVRLKDFMNLCLTQQKTPKEWKECHICSLFKKGNRKDPNCYRALSVTSSLSRLWGKLIQKRLRHEIGTAIGEDQSGFTPGRSCVDNLYTLQQVMEKKRNKDQELHIAFIDLKKAYDNVPRNKLIHTLKAIGTSNYLIRIIIDLYENNIAYVKQGRSLSEPIRTTKGLRQGCSLSPLLFNIYVEVILRKWKQSCQGMGLPINDTHLFTLSFADDQVIVAQDSFDLEFMLRRLYSEYRKWGLEVSLEKTEYLVVGSDAKFEVLINDDVQIRQIEQFKYLGVIIDGDGIGSQNIRFRIQEARKVIGALNSVWWDKNINRTNKKRIGRTMVDTVLTYGCEVWTMKQDDKRRIEAVEMDYLRRSSRISKLERVRNEEIRNIMSAQETIIDRIEKRSLVWFGHLLRMEDSRWPKRVLSWQPQGRNRRGRPRRSWNEGITRAMRDRGMDENMANDRVAWRLGMGMQRPAV